MKSARDSFRESVFERDGRKCVICGDPAKDAHHILERRLWEDGGYYLDNGASLCETHHLEAEGTVLSCEDVRLAAGINKVALPPDLYDDVVYTKWGDVILDDGKRMPGPLFYDESVQKILDCFGMLGRYTKYVKYPRTYHCPWSEGIQSDDRIIPSMGPFHGQEVVVTEKLDGENSNLYHDYYHARAIDGRNHWSRSWIKQFHAQVAGNIPYNWRVCGENMYAKHSIKYEGLKTYFYCFSIWNEVGNCLSWDDTVEWASMIGLQMVPVLYRGIYDEELIRSLYSEANRETCEGYVIRRAHEFPFKDFKQNVAKFVRAEHIGTSHHWFFTATEKNELR